MWDPFHDLDGNTELLSDGAPDNFLVDTIFYDPGHVRGLPWLQWEENETRNKISLYVLCILPLEDYNIIYICM